MEEAWLQHLLDRHQERLLEREVEGEVRRME